MDLALRYEKEFLKISLGIKSGEPRNCRFLAFLLFLMQLSYFSSKTTKNSVLTKTLPSASSIRRKKIENGIKDKVSRVEHTEQHTDRQTQRRPDTEFYYNIDSFICSEYVRTDPLQFLW